MKKFLFVCLLMFALSSPAFAGHTQSGDNRSSSYCECTPVHGVCPCCGAVLGAVYHQEDEPICQDGADGAGLTVGPRVIRLAFLMWLKLGA